MVDDIVLTQEEQVEQTKQWLKKNIPSIIIGLVLGIGMVYGYTTYQDSRITESQEASALYEKIIAAEKPTELAAENHDTFKSDYAFTPYAAKIALLHAKGLAESGKTDEAIDVLKWAESNAKEELVSSIAKLRQADIYLSENKLDDANKIVSQSAPKGFESNYLELKGDIAAAKEDYKSATQLYTEALNSGSVEASYITYLQLKINKMNSLSKSKG